MGPVDEVVQKQVCQNSALYTQKHILREGICRTDSALPHYDKDFPLTLMRGSQDGTIESDYHHQETLDLAV